VQIIFNYFKCTNVYKEGTKSFANKHVFKVGTDNPIRSENFENITSNFSTVFMTLESTLQYDNIEVR
jgi:hypothetical protein